MKKKLFKLVPIALLLVVVATVLVSTPVFAKPQSSDEIREEIKKLEQEQAALEEKQKELDKLINSNKNDIADYVAKKDALYEKQQKTIEQIDNINKQIAAYRSLIADKQDELDQAYANLEDLRKKYKARIRAMEEGGTISYWTVLFEADSFSDLLDRINIVQEIAAADINRMAKLDEATKDVEKAKQVLDAEKKALDETRALAQQKQAELAQEEEKLKKVLADLAAKKAELDKYMEEAEDAADELMDKLAAKADELTEAEKRELAEKEAQLQNKRPTFEKDGILWALPVDYRRLSSVYGYRTHPVTGQPNKKHNGVDLTAVIGTPVYATRSGKVSYVGYQAKGAGNYVNITHDNGFLSTYMHLNSYIVKAGEYVTIGQLIGYVGNTGGSTGPHLHFGIKKNGAWVNPANYLTLPTYYKK